METKNSIVDAGAVVFSLDHRYVNNDQGVSIQVRSNLDNRETELLRFDCFHHTPHYHYGPEKNDERLMLDKTTAGNPIGWTLRQLRNQLPAMLTRAGYPEVAAQINQPIIIEALSKVEPLARSMDIEKQFTITHNRGDVIVESGVIRFGLEPRKTKTDGGLAIHVLSDVAGQEIELLAFDCFRDEPHYHYGPRNHNEMIFWDKTLVPDPLEWTLLQFKSGKLPAMIERAGYPTIAAQLDEDLIASVLPKLEKATGKINGQTGNH